MPELSIDDYSERNAELLPWWEDMNGKQAGDPAKLAKALIKIASQEESPQRWLAGADAITEAERKIAEFRKQTDAYCELSASLAHNA